MWEGFKKGRETPETPEDGFLADVSVENRHLKIAAAVISQRRQVNWISEKAGPTVDMLEDIMDRLLMSNPSVRAKPPEVTLLNDGTPNAEAHGDGQVTVNVGLLHGHPNSTQNIHELAFVMAHELAHNHHQDLKGSRTSNQAGENQFKEYNDHAMKTGGEPVTQNSPEVHLALGIKGEISRAYEAEADAEALRLMAQAGYDPMQGIAFFKGRDHEDAGSTHPAFADRISAGEALIQREGLMDIYRQNMIP